MHERLNVWFGYCFGAAAAVPLDLGRAVALPFLVFSAFWSSSGEKHKLLGHYKASWKREVCALEF